MGKYRVHCLLPSKLTPGVDNFEKASLPTTTPEQRRRLLSFVVCGGGPTGVEAAAEIYDLCQEDIMQYYPKICRQEVSIRVIQSGEHILNTVSRILSFPLSVYPQLRVSVLRSDFKVCRGRLRPRCLRIWVNMIPPGKIRKGWCRLGHWGSVSFCPLSGRGVRQPHARTVSHPCTRTTSFTLKRIRSPANTWTMRFQQISCYGAPELP